MVYQVFNRLQWVAIDGKKSDWKKVMAGVPQRYFFGPLLFLVYINIIDVEIILFADDTILYVFVDNPAMQLND